MNYYITLLIVYFVVYAMSALSLNMQFGQGGIINFAFIVFQSAGAYACAITSLGSKANGFQLGQVYFWGTSLPFPLPFLIGGLAGGLLALVLGPATLRKMRRDYQAATMIVIAIIANQLVVNAPGFLNGDAGLSGVNQPLSSHLPSNPNTYSWIYAAWALAVCLIAYLFSRRLGQSPFGRTLRAIRDDEDAAAGIGKNPWGTRMIVFVIGGVIAGLSGAILIEFIAAWSPSAWGYQESFVILVAVILGGTGNERGSLVGAFVVGIVLTQAPLFLPAFGYPGLIDSLDWVILGVVWIVMLWLRPSGLIPERSDLRLSRLTKRPRRSVVATPMTASATSSSSVAQSRTSSLSNDATKESR